MMDNKPYLCNSLQMGLYNCLVGKVDHDYLLLNGCDMEEERLNTLKKEPQIENRDIFEWNDNHDGSNSMMEVYHLWDIQMNKN